MYPVQPRITILKGARIPTLWSQPIFDRDPDATELGTPTIKARIVTKVAPQNQTATMHPIDARQLSMKALGTMDAKPC
jgi:hypothetical protein